MANYATLKAAVEAAIKQNGNQEITGPVLQAQLLNMISSLGAGYQFAGVATASTNPGTPDNNMFWIAPPGTYENFSGQIVGDGYVGIFSYNGSWSYQTVSVTAADGSITQAKLAPALLEDIFASGYKYVGVAESDTDPGTPEQNVFWIAPPGTYENFSGHVVADGYIGIFAYDGEWELTDISVKDGPVVLFGTCATAAATAAKTVTVSNFVRIVGAQVRVQFTYANSAANPTLNVNGTGAAPIYYYNSVASASNTWKAGETVLFYFDGTNWVGSKAIPDDIAIAEAGPYDSGASVVKIVDTEQHTHYPQTKVGAVYDDAGNPLTGFSVVDDVTSGGTKKALSAEQGKILKSALDENFDFETDTRTFNVTDGSGNVIIRYDSASGLDVAKVSSSLKDKIMDSISPEDDDPAPSDLLVIDGNGYIGAKYTDSAGLDAAMVSNHLKEMLGSDDFSVRIDGNNIYIENLQADFRVAFRFTIDADPNGATSTKNIVTVGSETIDLKTAPVSILNVNRSTKNPSADATYQQQPKFNSGFSVLGLTNTREQRIYRPLVGEPAFWLWFKANFDEMEEAPLPSVLEARSETLGTCSGYSVKMENDRFSITNGGTEVFGTSLKSGGSYKSLNTLFSELKSGIGADFGLKMGKLSARLNCGDLLQFGEIKLVGNYYQHLASGSTDFGYHYDSFPVPIYLKMDTSVHVLEIVRKDGYLYASVDGICHRVSSDVSSITIDETYITIKDFLATSKLSDVSTFEDSEDGFHIVSDYSQAMLGIQMHFTENYDEEEKVVYSGSSSHAYSAGSVLAVYLQGRGGYFSVASISAEVRIDDVVEYNLNTHTIVNRTTGNVLGTAVSGQGGADFYETLSADNGVYYQLSVSRTIDALDALSERGYQMYSGKQLIKYLSGNYPIGRRSCFILKTDSSNGGGVYAYMKDKTNREIFDRDGVQFIIGSIIENEADNVHYFPTPSDYGKLVYAAGANGKDVISHSLTHDVQLESKCSILVKWELQENIRLCQEYGLLENLYSWPGSPCMSENIYTLMSLMGYVGSIGNTRGYNVIATQPFQIHRNDCADRTLWSVFIGYLF